jgi:hypothetical protein
MTSHDDDRATDQVADQAPGMGDPTRSDDTDLPGLRQGGAGRAPADQASGPAPSGDADPNVVDLDPGESGPQGGQLGSAGGGYGSGSATGSSGGTPDGEDVQAQSGPGPQTDWLRSAQGLPDETTDELGR